jgi:hypothetical protein
VVGRYAESNAEEPVCGAIRSLECATLKRTSPELLGGGPQHAKVTSDPIGAGYLVARFDIEGRNVWR